jgi:hypothetical protein
MAPELNLHAVLVIAFSMEGWLSAGAKCRRRLTVVLLFVLGSWQGWLWWADRRGASASQTACLVVDRTLLLCHCRLDDHAGAAPLANPAQGLYEALVHLA